MRNTSAAKRLLTGLLPASYALQGGVEGSFTKIPLISKKEE
jgi:hypothetical protein